MEQIKIKDLTFFYNKQEKPAIENLSFNIEKGDFVVLCGKSGCGKSTLLRCLKPIIKPYGKTLGDIIFENEKLEKLSERQQAEKIGFVMQNPEHQIVTDKVWHELAFGLESLGYSTDEIQLRVTEMAEYFGITDLYYNSVNQLSGGQKQLLNLAATMVMGPEILILDEPTAQLDPIAAENFLGTLKKINDELGHVVGDQIILKTADILKQIAHLHNCFISRYGGDEFIMVCERDKNEEITPVFNNLQRLFQQSYEGLPDFSVSIGYAKYDESLNYIPKFIEKADRYMYLNKNVKK